MWKYFLLSLVLVIGLQANDKDVEYDERPAGLIFFDNVRRKCLKLGNAKEEMFNNAEIELESCYRGLLSPSSEPEQEHLNEMSNFLCSEHCTNDFLKKVKVCLSPEEEFLLELPSSTRELCKNNRKLLKEKLKGYFDAECSGSPRAMVFYSVSMNCSSKLNFTHHKSEPEFVFKLADACSDLKAFHSCALDVVPKICGSDQFTKYVSVFYEPYVEWCDKKIRK